MKFAFLGDDPALLDLARASVALGHEAAWLGETGSLESSLRELAPAAAWGESWDALLHQTRLDGVVAGWSDRDDAHAGGLRLLAQAGIPLLLVHPFGPSMLMHFELDMIRAEMRSVLRHYNPGLHHPAIQRFRRRLATGIDDPIGAVEQLVLERWLSDRSKPAVLAALCRDIDLAAAIAGEMGTVGALGGAQDDSAYGSLTVQMTSTAGLPVRWSVGPAHEMSGGRLTFVGSRGSAMLLMPDDRSAWREASPGANVAAGELQPDWNSAKSAIVEFAAAITSGDDGRDWTQAAHCAELVDATERSVAKGRSVTIHFEEHSDQATFKGIMSALGCGLLMFGLGMLMLAGLLGFLGKATGFSTRLLSGWPVLVLVLMVIFLLLQLLPHIVFSDAQRSRAGESEDDADRNESSPSENG